MLEKPPFYHQRGVGPKLLSGLCLFKSENGSSGVVTHACDPNTWEEAAVKTT